MKLLLLLACVVLATPTIHNYKVDGIDGNKIDFKSYKGKKILVVNTASKCGYTKQYADLEKLYETYKDKLVIVGFPANNFGQQEPGTNAEIKEFCTSKFGVSFPMAAKISVKGNDIAPVYKFLIDESIKLSSKFQGDQATFLQDPVKWNFTKFLLDENGFLIDVFPSKINPMDESIVKYLK